MEKQKKQQKRRSVVTQSSRYTDLGLMSLVMCSTWQMTSMIIGGKLLGVGRVGRDAFPVIVDQRGKICTPAA